jgi:hypothetical protein
LRVRRSEDAESPGHVESSAASEQCPEEQVAPDPIARNGDLASARAVMLVFAAMKTMQRSRAGRPGSRPAPWTWEKKLVKNDLHRLGDVSPASLLREHLVDLPYGGHLRRIVDPRPDVAELIELDALLAQDSTRYSRWNQKSGMLTCARPLPHRLTGIVPAIRNSSSTG